MGSACCVAARDKTITNRSNSEGLHRNAQYSPSWSFRWDNRRRVAGEDPSVKWFNGVSGNEGSEIKSGTTVEATYGSEEGSPLDSLQTVTLRNSPISEGNTGVLSLPSSGQLISRNLSMGVKELTESPAVSDQSPVKLSPSVHSVSSLSTSPLSSQSHIIPASSTPSRLPRHSPGYQLLHQVSDSRITGLKSPNLISEEVSPHVLPGWSNGSTRGSNGGSSDGWSIPAFSGLMATSHRERWSFDSEFSGFNHDKIIGSSSGVSVCASTDLRTCGFCSKVLMTNRPAWSSQKIISTNELAVVAVLICGHVYHADCLENMTPEINKYDPSCPVCTFGEKHVMKLSEKALRAERDMKSRINKRLRNQITDSDTRGDSFVFDRQKSSGHEGNGVKLSSSSSTKSSFGRPFLRRHFSFASRGSRSSSNHSTQKKGFFWSKSYKE